MSLYQLCSNKPNPWATLRCQSLDVDSDVEVRGELAVEGDTGFTGNLFFGNIGEETTATFASDINITGDNTINFLNPSDVQRVTGTQKETYTFNDINVTNSTGDVTAVFSEFGGIGVGKFFVGLKTLSNFNGVPIWQFDDLPVRFRPTQSVTITYSYLLNAETTTRIGIMIFDNTELRVRSDADNGEFAADDTINVQGYYAIPFFNN